MRTDFRLVGAGGYSVPTPFRPLRAVPETLCGARDFTDSKCYRAFWTASTNFRSTSHHHKKFRNHTKGMIPEFWRRRRDSPTSLPLVARTRPLRPFTERSQFGIHRNGLFESHHHKRINGNHTIRHDFRLFGGDGEIRTRGRECANWFRVSPVMTTSIRLHIC